VTEESLRGAAGPLRREVVRGGDADPSARDDPHAQTGVLASGALVHLARREPREPAPFVHEQDLDVVHALEVERGLRDLDEPVATDQAWHGQRTPT